MRTHQVAAIPLAATLALRALMRTEADGPVERLRISARFSHQDSREAASTPATRAALTLPPLASLAALNMAKGEAELRRSSCFLQPLCLGQEAGVETRPSGGTTLWEGGACSLRARLLRNLAATAWESNRTIRQREAIGQMRKPAKIHHQLKQLLFLHTPRMAPNEKVWLHEQVERAT